MDTTTTEMQPAAVTAPKAKKMVAKNLAAKKLAATTLAATAKPVAKNLATPAKPARKAASARKAAAATEQAAKPAKAPSARAAAAEAIANGVVPVPPDFSANTHARFRKRLEEITQLVEAGNVRALKALDIKPVSSSPKAMLRYRDNAVIALEARAKLAKAKA